MPKGSGSTGLNAGGCASGGVAQVRVGAQLQGVAQDLDYNDTWHFALGAQYRFAEPWLWSFGVAYDTSPTDEDTRTPDLPLDRQIRIGTGIRYGWNKDVTLGVAYEYVDAGNAEIDQTGGALQGALKGDYDPNVIHFFAVNLIWKF